MRYISILAIVLMIFTGCASKSLDIEGVTAETLKKSLANYSDSCSNIAFAKTKAKLKEADQYKAKGKNNLSKKAMDEAVRLFKTEAPEYEKLFNANEAQGKRLEDLKSKRNLLVKEAKAANVQAFNNSISKLSGLIKKAEIAYKKCNVRNAKKYIDEAEKLIKIIENTVIITESETINMKGEKYTVKKGDCLWYIADKKYSDPFMWPIIYWMNKKSINDPDLIYPGQNLSIVYEIEETDKVKAVRFSNTRGPWSLYDNK